MSENKSTTCRDLQVRIPEPPPEFFKVGATYKDSHGTMLIQHGKSLVAEAKKQDVLLPATGKAASPQGILVTIDTEMGQIHAKYTHVYEGTDIVVMGLTETSFMPAKSTDEFLNQLKLVVGDKTVTCVYTGMRFKDGNGIDNIVLITMEKESVQ